MNITDNIHEEPIKAFALTNQEHQNSLSVLILDNEPALTNADPLTQNEAKMLEHYETIIKGGMNAIFQVGEALANIKNGKLYRDSHESFETYCREKWGFGRHRAFQFIQAHQVASELVTNCQQLEDLAESQLRPLVKLEPDQRVAALARASKIACGKKRTAKQIQQAVDEITGKVDAATETIIEAVVVDSPAVQIRPATTPAPTVTPEMIWESVGTINELLRRPDASQHLRNAFGTLKAKLSIFFEQFSPPQLDPSSANPTEVVCS